MVLFAAVLGSSEAGIACWRASEIWSITRSTARENAEVSKRSARCQAEADSGIRTVISELKDANPGSPDGEDVDVVAREAIEGNERRVHRAAFLRGADQERVNQSLVSAHCRSGRSTHRFQPTAMALL